LCELLPLGGAVDRMQNGGSADGLRHWRAWRPAGTGRAASIPAGSWQARPPVLSQRGDGRERVGAGSRL